MIKRVGGYLLGLLVLAFGVSLNIHSNLGVSSVNALPYVLSKITGRDLGLMVIAVYAGLIVMQAILLGREFKLHSVFQMVFSTVFGFFVDFAHAVVGNLSMASYPGKLFLLLLGIFLIGSGVAIYVSMDLIPMPTEGFVDAAKRRFFPKKHFGDVKRITDTFLGVTAVVVSLLFLGNIEGIREGTILAALLVGTVMKPVQKALHPLIARIFFAKK